MFNDEFQEVFPNEFTSGDGKKAHNDFGHFYGKWFDSKQRKWMVKPRLTFATGGTL